MRAPFSFIKGGVAAPTVSAIDKDLGDYTGGTTVSITVSSSVGCTSAAIGGVNLTSFTIADATHVTGVTGAMTASSTAKDVTVTNGGGTGTLSAAFEAFKPTNITNCVWWLRADLGITQVSGKVSAWADQSGLGNSARNASQSTSGDRPAYNSSDATYNNKATIGPFDATDGMGLVGSGAWSASYSTYTLCVVGHKNGADGYLLYGSATNYDAIATSAGSAIAYGGDATNQINSGVSAIGTAKCFTKVEFAGASSKMYSDSTATVDASGTLDADSLGSAAVTVGSYDTAAAASTTFGATRLAELFAYSRTLTSGENTRLRKYINDRYAKSMTG